MSLVNQLITITALSLQCSSELKQFQDTDDVISLYTSLANKSITKLKEDYGEVFIKEAEIAKNLFSMPSFMEYIAEDLNTKLG